MAGHEPDEQEGEAFLLIESGAVGFLLFPFAMAEVERLPPANDAAPAAAPDGPQDRPSPG
ncbi:hypothetical protein [Caldovatus aquaticus]|uniref:Uncharacterized protein n=1 Tax=Caldovatus aquaticus TaxID=2865671 RepID=A0ABS7F3K0_9PROT|nr:hypothetical protein [Caldovatus aquaticus]MBW8270177.1 hypothetical protein [Caldovatus aquaticus]